MIRNVTLVTVESILKTIFTGDVKRRAGAVGAGALTRAASKCALIRNSTHAIEPYWRMLQSSKRIRLQRKAVHERQESGTFAKTTRQVGTISIGTQHFTSLGYA